MIGSHFLKGWSRTQSNVTLSSAEAELYALIKMLGGATGLEEYDEIWGGERVAARHSVY